MASMVPKAVASAREARGPTCRMESATSSRHSGWDLAFSSSRKSFSVVAVGFEGVLAVPLLQKYGTSSNSPVATPLERFSRLIRTSARDSGVRSKSAASVVSGADIGLGGLGEGDGGFPAEGLDVEAAAAGQVEDAFPQLGRAGPGVGAADVHVPFLAGGKRRSAGGAFGGHDEVAHRRILLVPQRQHGADDLRDDVAGLAQDDDVADLARPWP